MAKSQHGSHEKSPRTHLSIRHAGSATEWSGAVDLFVLWVGTVAWDWSGCWAFWKIMKNHFFLYTHVYYVYYIYIYTYVRFIVQIVFSIIIYIYYHILSIFSRGMDQTTLVMPRIKTRNKWYGIATIMNISDILSSDINNKWI